MPRRIALTISVDLDPVPGSFHTEEDARQEIQGILDRMIPSYHPGVSSFTPTPDWRQDVLPLGDWKMRKAEENGVPKNWVKEEYYALPDLSLQNQKPETD